MTMLRSRSLVRLGSAIIVGSVFLLACGGGAATGGAKVDAQAALTDLIVETPSAAKAGSKTSDVSCTGPAPSEFGSGELCVDSGYRQDSKFSFANWGNYQYTGDTFNADEFVTLFGAANVCVSGVAVNCVLTTESQERLDKLNSQVAGGRCEGMVVMSALLAAGAVK